MTKTTIITVVAFALACAACGEKQDAAAPTIVTAEKPVAPKPVKPTVAPTVTLYNGLLYAEMEPMRAALAKAGAKVRVLWHDGQQSDNVCPDFIFGHSMGGNAAIRQAIKCQAAGHPPKAIISIDAGRAPLTYVVPDDAKYACMSYYNPAHPIGGQFIYGKCTNKVVNTGCGTDGSQACDHLYMPDVAVVLKGALDTIKQ